MKTKRMLFLRALILSASTIGGGYVIIAALRHIYVEQLHWMSEEDMLDITTLSQSAPGAAAVNASILLGYKLCGVGGAVVSVLGTILPPLGIMMLIAALYRNISTYGWITKLMRGMQACVAAVILQAGFGMTKTALSDRNPVRIVLFLLSLAAVLFTDIHAVCLIPAAALIGILPYIVKIVRRHINGGNRDAS